MIDHEKVEVWYNEDYKGKQSDGRRAEEAYQYFLNILDISSSRNILDIGCGSGELLKLASKKGLNVFGIDISKEALKLAKKKCPSAKLIRGKGEEIGFEDNTFDNVTCLGVLEHFLDIEKGLQEIARVAKSDSKICIMVPNRKFIGWIIKAEKDKGTYQKEISESLYSLKEWSKLISGNGLKIEKIIHDRGFIYNNEDFKKKSFKYFAKRILFVLTYLLPIKYTYQFIFICTKKNKLQKNNIFVYLLEHPEIAKMSKEGRKKERKNVEEKFHGKLLVRDLWADEEVEK